MKHFRSYRQVSNSKSEKVRQNRSKQLGYTNRHIICRGIFFSTKQLSCSLKPPIQRRLTIRKKSFRTCHGLGLATDLKWGVKTGRAFHPSKNPTLLPTSTVQDTTSVSRLFGKNKVKVQFY